MSFKFDWASFKDDDFYDRVCTLLTDALNKGKKPPVLSDSIVVRELYLGEDSPQLEILEVGDLAEDRFRGIFKVTYDGDASITLATKVQANPLCVYGMGAPAFSTPKFMGASASLDIPLNLTLSEIKLSGILIVVFSKAKGLTLVFKNGPLETIRVSSTFDAVPGIARFLQVQIESQIRSLFREDLPAILHRLSHKWTPNGDFLLRKELLEKVGASAPKKETLFMDVNPDLPVLSAFKMDKIDRLSASRYTLGLATPSIPDAMCRASVDMRLEPAGSWKPYEALDENSEHDFEGIARLQSRNYFRNTHDKVKPKRRVIKLGDRAKPVNAPVEHEQHGQPQDMTQSTPSSPSPAKIPVSSNRLARPSDKKDDIELVVEPRSQADYSGKKEKPLMKRGVPFVPPPAYVA